MITKNWREFVRQSREEYKKMRPVPCPAFGNELVHFNRHGFNHLIRKGRMQRKLVEVKQRLNLIKKISIILTSSKSFSAYRITQKLHGIGDKNKKSIAYFWSFISIDNHKKITVVIRQLDVGPKHFFSIFKEKTKKHTDP